MDCKNKIGYESKKEAVSTLKYIKKNARRENIPRRVYLCNKCNRWHFTSQKSQDIITYEFKLPKDLEIVQKVNDLLRNM